MKYWWGVYMVGLGNNEMEEAKTVTGMIMKIGVLSQDRIAFGQVEGDNPSWAIRLSYDVSDSNMKRIPRWRMIWISSLLCLDACSGE